VLLWGQVLVGILAIGRSVKWVWPTHVSLAFSQCLYVISCSLSCCGVKWSLVLVSQVGVANTRQSSLQPIPLHASGFKVS